MPLPNLTIRPLSATWDASALRRLGAILFRTSPTDRRNRQIETFVHLLQSGILKYESVLLAYNDVFLVGAILAESLPGATGLVWLPQAIVSQSVADVEDALVQAAIQQLRRSGMKSLHAYLFTEELPAGESFRRNGLHHLTRVWTMTRTTPPSEPTQFATDFQAITSTMLPDLIDTLIRTYAGTLDCPEMNDARSHHEIREGLLAAAPDLNLWWLLRFQGEPAGALILTCKAERCEINYLGIVPQLRRRGVATEAIRFALQRASQLGATEMGLIVDARNQPAIQLYRREGFQIGGSREVFWMQ